MPGLLHVQVAAPHLEVAVSGWWRFGLREVRCLKSVVLVARQMVNKGSVAEAGRCQLYYSLTPLG